MRLRIINGWPTTVVIAVAIPLMCLAPVEGPEAQGVYDLVIRNGRVMDPESGRDDKAVEGVAPGQWLRHTCAGESSSGH